MVAMKYFNVTQALVVDSCWRDAVTHDNLGGKPSPTYFEVLREALVVMKSNYLHLLYDRYHLLMLDEMYHGVLQWK